MRKVREFWNWSGKFPAKFNKLLNDVRRSGFVLAKQGIRDSTERTLLEIPTLVKTNLTSTLALRKASEEFYEDNKDLQPFKKVVAAVFEDEASKDPSKSYADVLKATGPEVRKRLELHKKATANDPVKKDDPPPLHGSKGGGKKQTKSDVDPLQKDINAMMDSLDE